MEDTVVIVTGTCCTYLYSVCALAVLSTESSGHPGDWIATRVNQLGRTVAGGDGVAMASHQLPLGGECVRGSWLSLGHIYS